MSVLRSALLLLAGLLLAMVARATAPSGTPTESALQEFERFVAAEMAKHRIPGLALGFVKGDVTWVRAFGKADIENDTPMHVDAAFRLASVQKTMTAVAVMQLVEAGRMDLDAEIQAYVPHFPKKALPITVRQLLTHQGGIPHYVNRAVELTIKEPRSTREAIAIFENHDLVAPPGTKVSYSSYGYNLLGAAIEGASGKSYAAYMRDHVWQPAGMAGTRLDSPTDVIPRRVRGYRMVEGKLENSLFVDISSRFAAGGTRGTVPDLLRFMQALNRGALLPKPAAARMAEPVVLADGKTSMFSMGWQILPFENRRSIVVNDGGQNETRTFILNFPEKDFALALAMNLEASVYRDIVYRLYEVALGEKLVMRR